MGNTYRVEARNYPEFEKEVMALAAINEVEGMECPNCGNRLHWYQDWIDEQYTEDGFECMEQFHCEECGTFVNATQVYVRTERRVSVMQEVFGD